MAASGSQAPALAPANNQQEGDLIIPNIRPRKSEVSPDPAWREWRMREQRSELNKHYSPIHPPIAPLLAQQGQQDVNRYANAARIRNLTFERRSMCDLRGHVPERLQFLSMPYLKSKWQEQWAQTHPREPFDEIGLDKLPDAWFEEIAQGLVARIWELASATFGQADLSYRVQERDWTGDMLRYLSPDFIRCASLVARGDPLRSCKLGPNGYNDHGYEHLFLANADRVFLCTAVISKLLKEHCLDSLLFGARPDEEETLGLMDKTTIGIPDGFARKFDRYTIVHKYMTDPTQHLFTARFWEEVDRVTTEILAVLLPLINMIGSHAPQAAWPPLTQVHQMLHNCVAEAAYLSNGEVFTRSCFWMDFPQPGQGYDQFQEHMTDTLWQLSKRAAVAHDANELENSPSMAQWRQARDSAYQQAGYQNMTVEQWSFAHYEPLYPKPTSSVRRHAKVQIAIFPFIQRSLPLDQDVANGGIGNKGNEISLIQKAQVVYYAGEDVDEWDMYSLDQHLQAWKRTFHPSLLDIIFPSSLYDRLGHLPRARSLIFGALFILLLWHLLLPSGHNTSQYLPWKLDRWGTSSSNKSSYASTTTTSGPWTSVVESVSSSLESSSASLSTLTPLPPGGTGTWNTILKNLGLRKDASVDMPRDALVGPNTSTVDEDETFPQSVASKAPEKEGISQERTMITSTRILGSTDIIKSPDFAELSSGDVHTKGAGLGDGTQGSVKESTTAMQASVQTVVVAEPDKEARKQTGTSHKTPVTTESAWENIIDHNAPLNKAGGKFEASEPKEEGADAEASGLEQQVSVSQSTTTATTSRPPGGPEISTIQTPEQQSIDNRAPDGTKTYGMNEKVGKESGPVSAASKETVQPTQAGSPPLEKNVDAAQQAENLATAATIPMKILPKTDAIPPTSATSTRHWYSKMRDVWDDARGQMGLSTSKLGDGDSESVLSSDGRTTTDAKDTSSSSKSQGSGSSIRPPDAESKQPAAAIISNAVTQRSAASQGTHQHPDGHMETSSGKSDVETSQTIRLLDTDEELQRVTSGVTPGPSQVTERRDITITNMAADPVTTIILKDITIEEYSEMMDRPIEKDGHWTVSDFFGIPYNCTFQGAEGTCFQTVEAPAVTVTVTV